MDTPRSRPALRRYLRHGMLPQLATLETVLRLGSATRAAEALCMAQPTLSGHLRKLGEALDVPLFSLQGRRMVPTEAALALQQTSREIFAALERCERALTDCRPGSPEAAQIVVGGGMGGAAPSHRALVAAVRSRGNARTAVSPPGSQHEEEEGRS